MDVLEATEGGVSILTASGRLDAESAGAFQQRVGATVDAGAERVVLDLTALDYISSAGLRVVLVIARRLQDAGGRLAICGLQGVVAEVFKVTGFDSIVDIHADRPSALLALS